MSGRCGATCSGSGAVRRAERSGRGGEMRGAPGGGGTWGPGAAVGPGQRFPGASGSAPVGGGLSGYGVAGRPLPPRSPGSASAGLCGSPSAAASGERAEPRAERRPPAPQGVWPPGVPALRVGSLPVLAFGAESCFPPGPLTQPPKGCEKRFRVEGIAQHSMYVKGKRADE